MPQILERLVSQLQAQGHDKQSAFAIATSQLQKHNILKKGTQELTPKGARRQEMGAAGRAKDRAAKASSGHSPSDYSYSPKTNQATLVKGVPHYHKGGLVEGARDPSSHRTPAQIAKMDHGYNHRPGIIKNRSERNQARAMLMEEGRVRKGDGKDVNHKRMVIDGGTNTPSNLNVETEHKNRGWRRDK